MAAVLICGIILCIWGVNILHNSSKQEETVSSEESSTTSTTAYQTETATQTTTQPDTEEAYFEEDTEEEVQIENAVKEITGEEVDLIASGRTDAGVHALRSNS